MLQPLTLQWIPELSEKIVHHIPLMNSNLTSSWPTNNLGMPQQSNNDVYHSQRPYETPTSPHAYINQQPSSHTTFDFNQLVVELFRCQTKLPHSPQWLHQQMADALENIAKFSLFQEKQHFINDIPMVWTNR